LGETDREEIGMRVGPKLVSEMIIDTIGFGAEPRDLETVIREVIRDHPEWERDPYRQAAEWQGSVREYLERHWDQAVESNRQPKIAFNSSSKYMVQGACYIEPADSPAVQEQKTRRLHWQDYYQALKGLEPEEFEILCKRLLGLLGVRNPRVTDYRADEGIDFYGRLSLHDLAESELGAAFPVFESSLAVWLVGQAKHYRRHKAATPSIRELVGSTSLGRARAFGGPDAGKYPDLKIRVCDPVFMLFFTTGQISSWGWRLADRSGVVCMDGEMVAAFLADKGVGVQNSSTTRPHFDIARFKDWLEL
jgi:hypothetical protein